MNFYNKHLLYSLLYFLSFCTHTMELNDIQKFKRGEIVKKTQLSNWQQKELSYLTCINLNLIPEDNDYTTEEESETTVAIDESVSKMYAMDTHQYFDWFNKNIQPAISASKLDREHIVNISKKRKISIEESHKKYDNTILLPFKQKEITDIIATYTVATILAQFDK